jgi:hypothetical protein
VLSQRNTFKVSCGITTQHTTSYEVTSSNDEGAPFDVAINSGMEGITGHKKRHKQCLQGAMTMTDHDEGNDREVGSSDVRCISTAACSHKRQTRPPTDYFKRLLEEACPNHVYHIRHKLKDCGMMMSFMSSGSLTWDAELDEGPDRSDMMPFPAENAVLMV